MEQKIFLKSLSDIEIKLGMCKTNFQWKLLAKQFEHANGKIEEFYSEDIPREIQDKITSVRESLVEKKGQLPAEDLII
jgi:hypothetical protein